LPLTARQALAEMAWACDLARERGSDLWEFAVSLEELGRAGLSGTTLRWLVRDGYIQHGVDDTGPDDPARRHRPVAHLSFTPKSCFVLTEEGLLLARDFAAALERPPRRGGEGNGRAPVTPRWVEKERQLWVGEVLLKEFAQEAETQETVLRAFQEEDWGPEIDNPLPPREDRTAEERLRDAIRRLNTGQQVPRIRFRSVRRGEAVCWELLP
jgi:hypothetical protein